MWPFTIPSMAPMTANRAHAMAAMNHNKWDLNVASDAESFPCGFISAPMRGEHACPRSADPLPHRTTTPRSDGRCAGCGDSYPARRSEPVSVIQTSGPVTRGMVAIADSYARPGPSPRSSSADPSPSPADVSAGPAVGVAHGVNAELEPAPPLPIEVVGQRDDQQPRRQPRPSKQPDSSTAIMAGRPMNDSRVHKVHQKTPGSPATGQLASTSGSSTVTGVRRDL